MKCPFAAGFPAANSMTNWERAMAYFLAITTALFAAPVPKTDPLPPITEAMWKQSALNLKQLGLALHSYHDVNGHFPQNVVGKEGKPLLSWRVLLLPYLEDEELYKEFKQTEPWDSEHNQKLLEKMPKVFAPIRVKPVKGMTYYLGFDGKDAIFGTGKPVGIARITDGCSNTAMLVEAGTGVPWTKPEDLPFDSAKDLPKLGGFFDGAFNVLLADGSVSRIKKNANASIIKLMVQMNDGQVFDVEALGK
jgi:hypothetical protein